MQRSTRDQHGCAATPTLDQDTLLEKYQLEIEALRKRLEQVRRTPNLPGPLVCIADAASVCGRLRPGVQTPRALHTRQVMHHRRPTQPRWPRLERRLRQSKPSCSSSLKTPVYRHELPKNASSTSVTARALVNRHPCAHVVGVVQARSKLCGRAAA